MAKHFSERNIPLALEALSNDKERSLLAAAKIHNVSEATPRRPCAGKPTRRDILANSRKLDLKEKSIVDCIFNLIV